MLAMLPMLLLLLLVESSSRTPVSRYSCPSSTTPSYVTTGKKYDSSIKQLVPAQHISPCMPSTAGCCCHLANLMT